MDDDNIMVLCRFHHRESHSMGWFWMTEVYPWLIQILKDKGWHIVTEFDVKKLRRI